MAATSISSAGGNTALTPLPASERLFGWRDHAALWLSLGVGLLVMQIGAYLVPALGTQAAMLVIVCGSVLGAGLLAWTAKIGCDSGLSSAGLMHATYGSSFARVPVLLNIVQLIGWTMLSWSSCGMARRPLHANLATLPEACGRCWQLCSGEAYCWLCWRAPW